MNLATKIKDDILYQIHKDCLDLTKAVLYLEYSDIESVYTSIANLQIGNVLSKLDPLNTITKENLYSLQKEGKDVNIPSFFVNLQYGNDTIVVVNNKLTNKVFSFQIAIYSINEKTPKEIKKYFDHTQYQDYKLDLNTPAKESKEDLEKPKEVKKRKEKMHFISERLIADNVDYLKLYQILAIEANNLDVLGKFTGAENVNLSTDNKLHIFANNLAVELLTHNQASLPKIPIITHDRKIVVLGAYEELEYIPSMVLFDTTDMVVRYTVLGQIEDIKPIVQSIKKLLSEYPTALDNRYGKFMTKD